MAKDLTATADELYVWAVEEPRDVVYLRDRGVPETELRALSGHESLRGLRSDATRRRWFLCRCGEPHPGECGAVIGPETPAAEAPPA